MPYHFTLELSRVRCQSSQQHEWGDDEVKAFGFGIARKSPPPFNIGFRNLGTFDTGTVNPGGLVPQTWNQQDLPDDGLELLLYFWVIEEDSGGVRGSAGSLETKMATKYHDEALKLNDGGFPRDCIPFTAFYKAIPHVKASLEEAATDGVNNDDVATPWDLILRHEGAAGTDFTKEHFLTRSTGGGFYELTLTVRYEYYAGINPILGEAVDVSESFES